MLMNFSPSSSDKLRVYGFDVCVCVCGGGKTTSENGNKDGPAQSAAHRAVHQPGGVEAN